MRCVFTRVYILLNAKILNAHAKVLHYLGALFKTPPDFGPNALTGSGSGLDPDLVHLSYF